MRKLVFVITKVQISLISAFVVRCLDSIIPILAIARISGLYLASVDQTPKTGFLETRLIKEWVDRVQGVPKNCAPFHIALVYFCLY